MTQLRADYAALKAERWDGFAGYDAWFERANNAAFGVLAAYNELVPHFERAVRRAGPRLRPFLCRSAATGRIAEGRAPRQATIAKPP